MPGSDIYDSSTNGTEISHLSNPEIKNYPKISSIADKLGLQVFHTIYDNRHLGSIHLSSSLNIINP